MPRTRSSYIPTGVITRGLGITRPSTGVNRASRGLILDDAFQQVVSLPDPAPTLSTVRFDSNGTQRLLSDDITALHFAYVGQELFANPDREYTGYAADGFWYTDGVRDPTKVPFKASWAVEGEGSPTPVRSDLDRFPERLIVCATLREVALFDADNADLWMRFVIGNVSPPGAGRLVGGPGTLIRDAVFTNGYLVIATNTGLRIADFRQDRGYRLGDAQSAGSGTLGLVNRDSDTFLDETSSSAPGVLLQNSDCLGMDAGAFSTSVLQAQPTTKNVRTVAACGHPDGITAVRLDEPGGSPPSTVRHPAIISIATPWEAEDDSDIDDTTPYFVDDNFGGTNFLGLGVQQGDRLIPDTVSERRVTLVEGIQAGRRLSVSPELNLTDSGSSYQIARAVPALLISPELHLYFASGSGALAVVRDQAWATTPGLVFSDLNVAGNNFSELAAIPETINDLARRGDLLLAATSLGVFVATDEDIDERRRAEFRYSTPAVTDVDATYKILEGTDANCAAISVDPETGNIQVAVTDVNSVVSDINPNIQQTFRFFDNVGRILALATFRNPVGPPDDFSEVS
jgi:hypothetical protein